MDKAASAAQFTLILYLIRQIGTLTMAFELSHDRVAEPPIPAMRVGESCSMPINIEAFWLFFCDYCALRC